MSEINCSLLSGKDCVIVFKSEDAVARLSGDEFVILIDSADTEELTALASQIVDGYIEALLFRQSRNLRCPKHRHRIISKRREGL